MNVPLNRRRVFPRDRSPITTLDHGVFRLVGMFFDERISDEQYTLARSLIADFFWISDNHLDVLVDRECKLLYPTKRPQQFVRGGR